MKKALLCIIISSVMIYGCASIDDRNAVRHEHIDSFENILKERELEYLSRPLSLYDCMGIAMLENYNVRKAELNRKLARLDRDIAFADFLPGVDASAGLTTWSHQPAAMGMHTTDKTTRTFDLAANVPIVRPSLWFMYANRKLGVSTADISAHYVCQSVMLEVAIAYYNCLVAEERITTLESQATAAKSQAERISGLSREGLAAAWQGEQAEYLHLARVIELSVARREYDNCKARLLTSMGLAPTCEIILDKQDLEFDEREEKTLDELVLKALENNPSLSIADHSIVMNENAVRQAITNFLPTLNGFVDFTFTSDSLAAFNKNIYGGFSAAWDLFSGFAHMAEYQAAKTRKKVAELDREALFLSIMSEVIQNVNAVENAMENFRLAEVAYNTSKSKFNDYQNKQKEGLIAINDMLDAQADMDAAQMTLSIAKYQGYLAEVSLRLVLGTIGGDWLTEAEKALVEKERNR